MTKNSPVRRPLIACIGAGNIGGEVASHCAMYELGDIALIDIPEREGVAKAKAFDIQHACALTSSDIRITGSSDLAAVRGADVCIVSAGFPRHGNMSRDDLLKKNVPVIAAIGEAIGQYAPESFVIVVTNPLDIMTFVMWKSAGCAPEKVVGMAGMLDGSRFKAYIAEAVGCSVKDVHSMVLGSHGDLMVPLVSHCTVNGIPVKNLLDNEHIEGIVTRARLAGGELVRMMGTSAFYAAGEAIVMMAKSYIRDHRRIMPCCAYLNGEYGQHDVYVGVPALIGRGGVEKVIELSLSAEEEKQFNEGAGHVKELYPKALGMMQSPSPAHSATE